MVAVSFFLSITANTEINALRFTQPNNEQMKTRNDLRLEFNKEKQLNVLVTDGTGFIHYSDDYVHWHEELVMKN